MQVNLIFFDLNNIKMTNKNNAHEDVHTQKKALEFVVEGKQFETIDQYKTGAELKQLAEIPEEVELYLSNKEPGYDHEIISNDTRVNLARTDLELFFVKKKLPFTINGLSFVSYSQYITGRKIRLLGNIDEDDQIFLDIKGPYQDDLIENDEIVDLARPGKEHFISRPVDKEVILIVNSRNKSWSEPKISFEQVVVLAFGSYNDHPDKVYTVTYKRGPEPKPEGTMVKGDVVRVKNKMIFNVTEADKS